MGTIFIIYQIKWNSFADILYVKQETHLERCVRVCACVCVHVCVCVAGCVHMTIWCLGIIKGPLFE